MFALREFFLWFTLWKNCWFNLSKLHSRWMFFSLIISKLDYSSNSFSLFRNRIRVKLIFTTSYLRLYKHITRNRNKVDAYFYGKMQASVQTCKMWLFPPHFFPHNFSHFLNNILFISFPLPSILLHIYN